MEGSQEVFSCDFLVFQQSSHSYLAFDLSLDGHKGFPSLGSSGVLNFLQVVVLMPEMRVSFTEI